MKVKAAFYVQRNGYFGFFIPAVSTHKCFFYFSIVQIKPTILYFCAIF